MWLNLQYDEENHLINTDHVNRISQVGGDILICLPIAAEDITLNLGSVEESNKVYRKILSAMNEEGRVLCLGGKNGKKG